MNFRLPLAALLLLGACTASSGPEATGQQAAACARLSACFDFEGIGGGFDSCLRALPVSSFAFGGGLGGLAGLRDTDTNHPVFQCVVMAEDCEAAGRCLNAGEPSGSCETSRCEGSVLRGCVSGVAVAYDCADDGDVCLENEGVVQCGQPASCAERTSECRAGRTVDCFNNVERSTACDMDCILFREQARCVDTSRAACEVGVANARCDGDEAVNCRAGFETSIVCPTGTCQLSSDGALCVVPRDCSSSTCQGDVLQACVGGQTQATDCREVGARTCADEPSGARCIL